MIRALMRGESVCREETDLAAIQQWIRDQQAIWVDLESPTPQEVRILTESFGFHPLAVEDAIAESHQPKADAYDDYLYLVMHTIVPGRDHSKLQTEELDVFLGGRYLVTHRTGPHEAVEAVWRRCRDGQGVLAKGLDFTLAEILDGMAGLYVQTLEHFEERIDQLEEQLFRKFKPVLLEHLHHVQRDLARVRRVAAPQRDVLHRIARAEFAPISQGASRFFSDIYDHFSRVVGLVETLRDTATSAMNAYLNLQSHKLNEIMKVLTIVSLFFLPLGVIVGYFGMNFRSIAEFRWPMGHMLAWGFMLTSTVGLYIWMKQRKWL